MGKTNDSNHAHVVIFVEGDTDELFFKALVEHYRQHSDTPLLPCGVCNLKGVTRYTSKLLAKLNTSPTPAKRIFTYRPCVAHTTLMCSRQRTL